VSATLVLLVCVAQLVFMVSRGERLPIPDREELQAQEQVGTHG
jgi:hypothetical protein